MGCWHRVGQTSLTWSAISGSAVRDCRHQAEPGCAVRAAIASGELPRERWESYLKLKREARFAEDKAEYLRQKEQWAKGIAKWCKQMQKQGGFRK